MEKGRNEDKLINDETAEFKLKSNNDNPTFLHSETERRFGAKVDIELEKKNGKAIYRKKIRYGGFYYLGSLIGVIFLTIVVGICIYDTFIFIKNRDLLNLVFFFIISIGCSAWDYYYLKKLIKEIKEKRKDKEMIKKGLKVERKISFLERLHGAAIILILTFMVYATFALIIQETKTGIVIPKKVNMIIFVGFFVLMVIIVFIEFIVIAIDMIKR